MNADIPATWSVKKFGSIAEIKLGKMLDKARNSGVSSRYLRNVNVRWGHFDLNDLLDVPLSDAEREALSIQDGDLLVCEGGEPGRCAVWRGGPTDLKYQKAIHRVRFATGMVPEFFAYHIQYLSDRDRLGSGPTNWLEMASEV